MIYMLERLLKSGAEVRLLELLLFEKPLHLRELARRAKVAPIHAKRELESLGRLGLALNSRVGNLSVWSINKKSPIYEEMKRIFLKTESLGGEIGIALCREDVKFALIYGSFAHGTEAPGSDIDLLLVGRIDERAVLRAFLKVEKRIGREINFIIWSEKEFLKRAAERHPLLVNIAKSPLIWVKGDEGEFRKAVAGRAG